MLVSIRERTSISVPISRVGLCPKKAIDHCPVTRWPIRSPPFEKATMSDLEGTTPATPAFTAKSPIQEATRTGLQGAAIGLFFSAIQNALGNHSHGAMGVFTRTGGTIGVFGVFNAFLSDGFFSYNLIIFPFLAFSCYGCHIYIHGKLRCQ